MKNEYPSRPVRIIVPLPAGGPADILARMVGQQLAARWCQEVIVENLVGRDTIDGTAMVARAIPDGYTLLVVPSQFTVHPRQQRDLPYDVVKDFIPVILMAIGPNVLVVNPSVSADSVQELVTLAKSKPGILKCASGGNASATYRAAEMFRTMAGIDLTIVTYKGAARATKAVLTGMADMLFSVMAPTIPHVQARDLKALAVTGPRRSRIIADVPTLMEAGFPNFEVITWQGLFAPHGTAREVIIKLNSDIAHVLQLTDLQQKLSAVGFELTASTPEEFAARIEMEVAS